LNLNKLIRFDHLTEEGRLNKIYTILLVVAYIIIFFISLSFFPEDTHSHSYGFDTFLVWLLLVIEIIVAIVVITMCWSVRLMWYLQYYIPSLIYCCSCFLWI
jgi:hypothetical protein